MVDLEKAKFEQVVGEAWYDGVYTEAEAKIISEIQGLSWDMVLYWYGREYAKDEALSNG